MDILKSVLKVAFGEDWVSSLVGMGAAAVGGAVAFASGHTEPGFYILALGLAALGRMLVRPKPK